MDRIWKGLSSPIWQGIQGFLTVLAIVLSVYFFVMPWRKQNEATARQYAEGVVYLIERGPAGAESPVPITDKNVFRLVVRNAGGGMVFNIRASASAYVGATDWMSGSRPAQSVLVNKTALGPGDEESSPTVLEGPSSVSISGNINLGLSQSTNTEMPPTTWLKIEFQDARLQWWHASYGIKGKTSDRPASVEVVDELRKGEAPKDYFVNVSAD